MSTTPPAQPPPPPHSYERPCYGTSMPLPVLNGELVVFLVAWVVVLVVTLTADTVDWPHFVTATVALAVGYMLSRGIAKAGKVVEAP